MAQSERRPVIELLEIIHKYSWSEGGKSWQRLNVGLQQAINVCLDTGVPFREGDVVTSTADGSAGPGRSEVR